MKIWLLRIWKKYVILGSVSGTGIWKRRNPAKMAGKGEGSDKEVAMRFTKMQGCGNDYVYIDGGAQHILAEEKPELVRRLSDRHFGVGGDGVIFINP